MIPAGGPRSVTLVTGVPGTATLRFRAGGETRELTVVVGTPAPGTEPPIIASPVGVVVIQQAVARDGVLGESAPSRP